MKDGISGKSCGMVTGSVRFHGFFDPESHWCLPVRCTKEGCSNIISGETVESLQELDDGRKEVTCDECHYSFTFVPSYASGDPRNIVLMGKSDTF